VNERTDTTAAYDEALPWHASCGSTPPVVLPLSPELFMKPVSALLHRRPTGLFTTRPDATVFDALQVLADHEVGALVVLEGDSLAGVFSERDYTRKVALQGRNSRDVKVADIMTADVFTCTPQTSTHECMALMSQKRIRHLPVVEGAKVVAMLSIRDLMDDLIADHEQTIDQLRTYIQT
jgi:CBS domain-containing protein